MTVPTLDDIQTAVGTWRDTYIGIDAIGANTEAYNQIFDTLDDLSNDMFAVVDDVSEAFATSTLTFTAGTIADDKIELGGVYYVPVTTPSGTPDGSLATPYQVAKGADATAFLANLRKAINATGVAGTDYSSTLAANALANSTASNATTLSAKANLIGADGNSITTSVVVVSSADGFAWTGATMAGGAGDDVPLVLAVIDDWRDILRGGPVSFDDDSENQLDAAVPALKTSIEALFT